MVQCFSNRIITITNNYNIKYIYLKDVQVKIKIEIDHNIFNNILEFVYNFKTFMYLKTSKRFVRLNVLSINLLDL